MYKILQLNFVLNEYSLKSNILQKKSLESIDKINHISTTQEREITSAL